MMLPVRHSSHVARILADRVANLRSKVAQIAHGRIFFENDLAVLFCINLQRVTLADAQGSADLLGDDDAAQIIDPADNTCCFHRKNVSFCSVSRS